MSKRTVTIRGRTYNMDDAADLVSVQSVLIPDEWPGKRGDGVRLFNALQEMLALQLRRHFAANFKQLARAAIDEGADGGAAKIGATFAFEVDFTSPMVAALTKLKMSFSVRHGTEGKPQTYDLTQGELPLEGDDMSVVFDVKSLVTEAQEATPPATGPAPNELPATGGDGGTDTPPSGDGTQGDATTPPKRKRGKKD